MSNLLKQTAINYLISKPANDIVVHYSSQQNEKLSDESIEITRLLFIQLMKECENIGSTLIVFYIPAIEETKMYRHNEALSEEEMAIRHIVDDNAGHLISLTHVLAQSRQPIDRLFFSEGRWTALAHSLAADFMSKHVRDLLSLRSAYTQTAIQDK